ncbi:MAG: DUF4350 domain-containing protein [Halolamina sp.]
MRADELRNGLGVAVASAFVIVVVAAAAGPLLTGGTAADPPAELDNSEYAVGEVASNPEPAVGEIRPDASGDGATVLIDVAHANRIQRTDLTPLIRGFQRAGLSVRFHESGDLDAALSNASAFVVVDPGIGYTQTEVESLQSFTDDGGRVLLFAEPNTITVSGGLRPSVTERETNVERIGTAYGLSFSPEFVYNQRVNDGNYKRVVARPENGASDVGERVVLDTTGYVVPTGEATVLLRTPEGTATSGTDRRGRYAVGVRTGNLVAVTDSSLLGPEEYNVADNEAFLSYLVAFLADGDGGGAAGETQNETGNSTATETATPTPA